MRKIVRKLAALPLVVLVMTPGGTALAQTASGPPAATSPGGAGGAVRSDLVFSLTARYDSNVPRLNDETVNIRNLEKEDIRISPALQLDVSRNLGRHQVGLRSYLGYDFYIRNTTLNRERLSVEPYVYLDLPVCDLALSGLAARQQSDLAQLVYVGLDPTIGADNTETRKRINGKLICGETYGLRPTLEIERASGDNSNPLRQIADYRVTRIQPGVSYASPALGEVSLFAFKQDTDLPNQILPNGEAGGYTLRGFGVQYARNIGTRLNFNGSVSHVEVTPYGGTLDSRSGLNASVALTLLASDRLQLTAFANRNFTSTLTSTSTYELAQGYGLTANYAANDRLRLRLGGQVAPRRFFYAVTPTGPFIGEQTQYDIFGGVTYNLNRRLRLNLDGGYQRRNADFDIFDYESVYAAVGISVSL
jgi:hypothetical protein